MPNIRPPPATPRIPRVCGAGCSRPNHKDIGTLYLGLAIVGMFIGGTFSILMRINLQSPGHHLFSDGQMYNVIVTGHGLIMIFFVIMPALIGGLGNWFVPLMIGAPDMAFPRMNNLSFWFTAGGMCLLLLSTQMEGAPGANGVGAGWTLYAPFSTLGHPGPAVDFGILALHTAGAGRSSAPSTSSPRSSTCARPA